VGLDFKRPRTLSPPGLKLQNDLLQLLRDAALSLPLPQRTPRGIGKPYRLEKIMFVGLKEISVTLVRMATSLQMVECAQ
jgi:hypothetical protein